MSSSVGLAVTVGMALILLAVLVISHLGAVVHDGAEEDMDIARSSWKEKCWSCRASLVKTIPFTAIKIVVTVWQILAQVCKGAGFQTSSLVLP